MAAPQNETQDLPREDLNTNGKAATSTECDGEGGTCPIAATMDVIGDRWTLIIIRDLLGGKTRFGEFVESPEHIPTNVLTDRLRRLEGQGVIERRQYSERPPRYDYVLTEKGRTLRPVLHAICTWGNLHYPFTHPPADWITHDRRPS